MRDLGRTSEGANGKYGRFALDPIANELFGAAVLRIRARCREKGIGAGLRLDLDRLRHRALGERAARRPGRFLVRAFERFPLIQLGRKARHEARELGVACLWIASSRSDECRPTERRHLPERCRGPRDARLRRVLRR